MKNMKFVKGIVMYIECLLRFIKNSHFNLLEYVHCYLVGFNVV